MLCLSCQYDDKTLPTKNMTVQPLLNSFAPISAHENQNSETLHRLIIPYGGRHIVIPINQITCLEGEGNYTFLCTNDSKRYLVSKTLKSFESILERCFVRIHKSSIINVNYLKEIGKEPDRYVELKCGKQVPISRRKIKEVCMALSPFVRH